MIFQNNLLYNNYLYNFTIKPLGKWKLGQFWNVMSGTYAKYLVEIMPLFVYTTTWGIQSCRAICLFSSSCFSLQASPAVPDIELHRLMFLSTCHLVFWILIQFLNLLDFIIWQLIFPWFSCNLHNYFVILVTMVTVIFTCRYFK